MSKKHFIALADKLRYLEGDYKRSGLSVAQAKVAFQITLDTICSFCRSENGRFNEDRFRGYINGECGPNGGAR